MSCIEYAGIFIKYFSINFFLEQEKGDVMNKLTVPPQLQSGYSIYKTTKS